MTTALEASIEVSRGPRQKSTPKQLEKHLWKPGQSGNPSGRAKGTTLQELKEMSRTLFPVAMKRLEELMNSRDERIALEAVQFAYLYTFGKPQEGRDLAHLEAMRARMTELVAVPVQEELPAPEAPVVTPEALHPTLPTPESPEATDRPTTAGSPVSAPSGLRCLHRGVSGQCEAAIVPGKQWCQSHLDKLFGVVK